MDLIKDMLKTPYKNFEMIKFHTKDMGHCNDGIIFLKNKENYLALKIAVETKKKTMLAFEFKIMRKLMHDNIVSVYEFKKIEQILVMEMEYVIGSDLLTFIMYNEKDYENDTGDLQCPIKYQSIQKISNSILSALVYLKNEAIAHNDIKPENILISNVKNINYIKKNTIIKLCDFGLATDYNSDELKNALNSGSIAYYPPEKTLPHTFYDRVKLSIDYGHAGDIFSFGCTLYTICTSQYLRPNETMWGFKIKVCKSCGYKNELFVSQLSRKCGFCTGNIQNRNKSTNITYEENAKTILKSRIDTFNKIPNMHNKIKRIITDSLIYEPLKRKNAEKLLKQCKKRFK